MVWSTPGRHQVAVQHAGFSPAIEDVVVDAGKTIVANFDLRPIDLRAPNPGAGGALVGAAGQPERKPIYRRPWFWVATGAVIGAGVAIGVVLATRGSSGPETTLGAQRAF
jgi:hypothetical protein